MLLRVYSGRPSEGAAFLAAEDGFIRLRTGKFNKPGDVIVNWGNVGDIPGAKNLRVLNVQAAVAKAINKRTTFQVLAGANVETVPWTANKAVAREWLNNGLVVVARKTLTGHEGAGIVIVEKAADLIDAPLYTQYINKVREFRVHATQYGVIDTQWKVHDPKLGPPKSWKIRSYANGFIFQRKGVIPSAQRDALAIQAVKALGLDFGGLDIIEDKQGNFYVVEVNTAPGIEGTTVSRYAMALRQLAGIGFKPNPVAKQPDPYAGLHPLVKPGGYIHAPGPAGPGLRPVAAHTGPRNLNRGWAA